VAFTGLMSDMMCPPSPLSEGNDDRTWIVYDGECPFCTNYVALMQIRRLIGDVELLDARKPHPIVRLLIDRGYDLNEGMVVICRDQILYGKGAVVFISLLSGDIGWFGQALRWILRGQRRASFLYPIMKLGRRLTLFVLGRRLIRDTSLPR
jgi:predicted DCC family thiol-disulfide oxidoreductase YuxK